MSTDLVHPGDTVHHGHHLDHDADVPDLADVTDLAPRRPSVGFDMDPYGDHTRRLTALDTQACTCTPGHRCLVGECDICWATPGCVPARCRVTRIPLAVKEWLEQEERLAAAWAAGHTAGATGLDPATNPHLHPEIGDLL